MFAELHFLDLLTTNGIAKGEFSDVVHTNYFRNVAKFHGIGINVTLLRPIRKAGLFAVVLSGLHGFEG